jgi:biopolymer transport protein TolQ
MTERIFAVAHYADQGVLYLLITLTLMAVFLIGSRYRVLKRASDLSKNLSTEIERALLAGDYNLIEDLAENQRSVEGRICRVALTHFRKHGLEGIEEVFRTMSSIERPKLERSLGFLATVGSNAPYIGLFGTVLGIMKSFHDLAQATEAGQNTVMAGISAALVATAAGLMVAIPSVLAYNYFQKQVKSVMSSVESAQELFMIYARLFQVHDRTKGEIHGR